jgi:hypothetical protein
MANNFKIQPHRDKDDLHLQLKGDFDGTSALELINILKDAVYPGKILIHTDGLKKIYPFGWEVFESNLFRLNGNICKLIFTGKNKHHFMPKKEVPANEKSR